MYLTAARFLGSCCKWQEVMSRIPKGSHTEERAEREGNLTIAVSLLPSTHFLRCSSFKEKGSVYKGCLEQPEDGGTGSEG